MALFRKFSSSVLPAFRKLPGQINTFGRKLTNTTNDVGRGLDIAQKAIDTASRVSYNPLLKVASGAISGVRDINKGVGIGGQALRAASDGNALQAGNLALDAVVAGGTGVGKSAASVAPLLLV